MLKAHNAISEAWGIGIRHAFRSSLPLAFLIVLISPSVAEPGFGELWAPKPGEYKGASAFARPMPWQVGQYVLYGSTEKGERKTVFRTLIAGHEGDTWTVEIWPINGAVRTESEEGRNVTVLLAFGFDGVPRM